MDRKILGDSKKTAFITGITGMVGSHLADFLLEQSKWKIVGGCRWRSPSDNVEHLYPIASNGTRVQFVSFDLLDPLLIKRILEKHRPDFIFHLAAQSFPVASFEAPTLTYHTNIVGTDNLLRVVAEMDDYDPLIHVCSSSEVFGRVPEEMVPIDEECKFHPASPYAISKIGTDLLGTYYHEAFGLKTLITRMFTHTGPRRGDFFVESTFAKQIALIEANKIPPVLKCGNLQSMRTFADVRDAVKAYVMLMTVRPVPGEAYNIGGSYSCTIAQMLEFLLSLSETQITVEVDPARIRPIDADLQIPNLDKFQNHTGWVPEISFEKTMRDLLNYWRQKVNSGREYLPR